MVMMRSTAPDQFEDNLKQPQGQGRVEECFKRASPSHFDRSSSCSELTLRQSAQAIALVQFNTSREHSESSSREPCSPSASAVLAV